MFKDFCQLLERYMIYGPSQEVKNALIILVANGQGCCPGGILDLRKGPATRLPKYWMEVMVT